MAPELIVLVEDVKQEGFAKMFNFTAGLATANYQTKSPEYPPGGRLCSLLATTLNSTLYWYNPGLAVLKLDKLYSRQGSNSNFYNIQIKAGSGVS
jgi:hypothetical protein